MKIILKFDDDPEPPIEVLLSVVRWAQKNNDKVVAARFEFSQGDYWAYKTMTKTGTKVVSIRG